MYEPILESIILDSIVIHSSSGIYMDIVYGHYTLRTHHGETWIMSFAPYSCLRYLSLSSHQKISTN